MTPRAVLLLGGSDTLILPLLIYQQVILINNNFAAALGVYLLVVSVLLLAVVNRPAHGIESRVPRQRPRMKIVTAEPGGFQHFLGTNKALVPLVRKCPVPFW